MSRNWTPQQKNAIYATDGSVLVSAAAGSGKTAVLVERVIKLITREKNPLDVDRLLIVTFTRAAAAGRKIFWRRFFMIVIGKTYNKSKKKGNIQTPHFLL